jgi:hypothetical protein
LTWGRPLPEETPVHEKALLLQNEILKFLKIFSWEKYLFSERLNFELADVGARTFSFAPAFESFFSSYARNVKVSGIEIDAYRRFTNLRTRRDYGEYYAKKVRYGEYFPQDFLKWEKSVDLVLMLHPFVTPEPHENWGLPQHTFKPDELFAHSFSLLRKKSGLMLLSSPNLEEFEIAKNLALKSGFVFLEESRWLPTLESIQKQPRLGALFAT